jgi:hypothetical protein
VPGNNPEQAEKLTHLLVKGKRTEGLGYIFVKGEMPPANAHGYSLTRPDKSEKYPE